MRLRLLLLKMLLDNLFAREPGFGRVAYEYNKMVEFRADLVNKEFWRIDTTSIYKDLAEGLLAQWKKHKYLR